MPKLVRPEGQSTEVDAFITVFGRRGHLTVLRHLAQHGPSYRRDIVTATGLPAPTVGAYLATLQQNGIVAADSSSNAEAPDHRGQRRGRLLRYELRRCGSEVDQGHAGISRHLRPRSPVHAGWEASRYQTQDDSLTATCVAVSDC